MNRARKLLELIFALSLVACAPGGGSSGGSATSVAPQTATTPLSLNCINGTTLCSGNTYANYGGWTTYALPYNNTPYNYIPYFNQYGFCGCPSGYSPAYNATLGLGCVNTMYLQSIYGNAVFMGFGASGFLSWGAGSATTSIPQVSNIPGAPNQGTCTRQITQSCILNQFNTCGVGAFCSQILTGSNLGVCINPSANYNGFNGYSGYNGYVNGYPAPVVGGVGFGVGFGGYIY